MKKSKPVILIVDDQLQNIELLETHLVTQGYEIVQAESGEEALNKLSSRHVDLVLLDAMMPGMSGIEALEKIRTDKKAVRIPIVMTMVFTEAEDKVKALEAGCDDIISKPVDKHELIARVKSLLRIKTLNDEVDDSREYAESVVNTVREPLIVLDQELRVVNASRSFYEVFQVTPQETVGRLIYDLGNNQWDIPKLRDLLETILPQKTVFNNYEVEHEFAAIGRRVMLLNARQIKRGIGKERIILLAIEDITGRKRLEDLLAESEERYRRIFETASDGIVLLEKSKGRIIHVNPATEKMLGYSEEECIGKNIQTLGVSLDMSDFPTIMQSLNKRGVIYYDDIPVKTRSGQEIYTDIYMVDRAKLAQCNIRDITVRKRADETLKGEKAFIENALNTLKDVFFVFDLEGRFLRWNKTMNAVTGYSDANIALIKAADLFRNDDTARVSEAVREALQEGSASVDATLITKDGRQIPYEIRASQLRDHTGNVIGISGVGRDLTERNKLEAQLLHSQKMEAVGTLAGGIAHDFNNILNVMIGYGIMVMDKLEAGNPSREYMNEVLVAADRAAALTKRLLVFSRKQVVEVKPVNISELILGLQNMLVRIIRESIDFNLDLADRPLIAPVDAGQIEQVLINLAANACDAMPDGGRLTISTKLEEVDDAYVAAYGYGKPGKYALITVSDTGQGMDAETQKKIFEPFFTTKGVGQGTGLGLAISYGIIKHHNGYIKVYSEPGQGSVFKIYLPLSEEASSPRKKAEAVVSVKGGSETVLLAEDDASMRKMTRIILESYGYSVIIAADGEDVITKFMENRKKIGLVLLDMIMPKKNGKEAGEAIRKVSPDMKILFSSGYTMEIVNARELTEAGADFIRKPFLPNDLLIKVREVLDR